MERYARKADGLEQLLKDHVDGVLERSEKFSNARFHRNCQAYSNIA